MGNMGNQNFVLLCRCKHVFCENCALKHHKTGGGSCAECGAPTGGSFAGIPRDLRQKIEEKVKRRKEREEQVREKNRDLEQEAQDEEES